MKIPISPNMHETNMTLPNCNEWNTNQNPKQISNTNQTHKSR